MRLDAGGWFKYDLSRRAEANRNRVGKSAEMPFDRLGPA